MIIGCLSACKVPVPEPPAPVLEISSESCTADFDGNSYTLNVTHVLQGITTVTVVEPKDIEGVVYNFSGNGCEITLGELSFQTDKSFMNDHALPQMIHDIFTNAQAENSLAYTDSESSDSDMPSSAIFNGKCDSFSYEIVTDYGSGIVREIRIPEWECTLCFS